MSSLLDGIGFLVVISFFFGLPIVLVGYGLWVALVRGPRSQPVDQGSLEEPEDARTREDRDRAA